MSAAASATHSMELRVPVFLAPSTRAIVPVSSRREQPSSQGPAPGFVKAVMQKHIARQFLCAARDTQTLMLRHPGVVRAIRLTLGESSGVGKCAGWPPPAPATGTAFGTPVAMRASNVPGLPASTAGVPALPVPPPASVHALPTPLPAVPAIPKAQQWAGNVVLTRKMEKPLKTQATLVYGKVQLAAFALRTAAGNGGVLNVSHRVPFDDLARRTPGAVLTFLPDADQEHLQYRDYVKYFGAKVRAGVVKLNEVDALYIVPAVSGAVTLLKALQAAGTPPLATNVLLGVLAAAPSPSQQHGPLGGAAATAAAQGLDKPSEPRPEEAKPPVRFEAAEDVAADKKGEKPAEAAAAAKDGDGKGEDEDNDPEMSMEALLELFSKPELIEELNRKEPLSDTVTPRKKMRHV